ncbi:hypothetical protein [Congregibacter sp.]|uniref:hypothetical protein n=1 Tax=Congregibacter sp. TaxID=2744308 RepID=UPI003F6D23CF
METLEDKHAELDVLLARIKRKQRIHHAYTLAVLLLGIMAGFVIAQWYIDPVTVIPPCGGMQV